MRTRGLRIVSVALLILLTGVHLLASQLPQRISDDAFRQLIGDFSEPEGTSFGGDNFVSNETLFQVVIPALKKSVKPGGVYLGVGPEQNFSYIAALRPQIAFIIDIRRQNLLEHLMYKALFEASADRAEFVSLLFSRKRPSNIKALFQAYDSIAPDQELHDSTLKMIKDRLARHGFQLSADDLSKIDYIFDTFFKQGPQLNFVGRAKLPPEVSFPNFEDLMLQTDGKGTDWSFLANEGNFRICKDLEERNLIIPVTGDFAGPRTVRAVGNYIREHGAEISAIYASNVEEYLFQEQDNWKKYYSNLSTLPLTTRGSMIRSISVTNAGVGYVGPGLHTVMITDEVSNLVQAFNSGKIANYLDVIRMSRCSTPDLARFGCRF